MSKHILITGGAGFIGSHLADELLARGYRVRVLDCLAAQVHGPEQKRPDYLSPDHAYAEYDCAPEENVVVLPDALLDQPFPAEPLGCAINIFRRCQIRPGQTIAIWASASSARSSRGWRPT